MVVVIDDFSAQTSKKNIYKCSKHVLPNMQKNEHFLETKKGVFNFQVVI
jgi:hypothetical protein